MHVCACVMESEDTVEELVLSFYLVVCGDPTGPWLLGHLLSHLVSPHCEFETSLLLMGILVTIRVHCHQQAVRTEVT